MHRWCCTIGLCPYWPVQSVIAGAGRNESREPYAASLGNRLDQAALQCAYGFDVAEKDIALICNFEAQMIAPQRVSGQLDCHLNECVVRVHHAFRKAHTPHDSAAKAAAHKVALICQHG